MKESARAAREELALKRQIAAVKELVGEERAAELSALSGPARYPEVNALLQQETIADILEGLAGIGASGGSKATDTDDEKESALAFLTNQQREALDAAGYESEEALRLASDEELIAVKYIGEAAVEKIREAVGKSEKPEESDDGDDTPDLSFLTEEQAEALHDAGYTNPDEMRAASDEDLEAVEHVGQATVEKIREAVGSSDTTVPETNLD